MSRKLRVALLVLGLILTTFVSIGTSAIVPLQPGVGLVVTSVYRSNGVLVGSNEHLILEAGSGIDKYYDPSAWGNYKAGASISCCGRCSCEASDYCSIHALNVNTKAKPNIKPQDWYGYDECDYSGICKCGCVYGTVRASCSTIYGCYIDVEWHAGCYNSGI